MATFPKLTDAQERAWDMIVEWHGKHNGTLPGFTPAGGEFGSRIAGSYGIPATEATFKALVKKRLLLSIGKGFVPNASWMVCYSIHPDYLPAAAPAASEPDAPAAVAEVVGEDKPKFKVGDMVTPLCGGWQGCTCKVIEVWVDMFGITRISIQAVIDGRGIVAYKESELKPYQSDEPDADGTPATGERAAVLDTAAYEARIAELEASVRELETLNAELKADMEIVAARELELVQQNTILNNALDKVAASKETAEGWAKSLNKIGMKLSDENAILKTAARSVCDRFLNTSGDVEEAIYALAERIGYFQ